MLAPPPPPPPPRAFSAPPPPEPATATPRGGGVRLFQSRVVAMPTVTNKQTMRPAGTPRHDGMAAAKEVIFGGQASWLARGSGTPRVTQPRRGSRTDAAARKNMRSDVDEVVFGRDMDFSSGADAAVDDSREGSRRSQPRRSGARCAHAALLCPTRCAAIVAQSSAPRPSPRPAPTPTPKALPRRRNPPSPCDLLTLRSPRADDQSQPRGHRLLRHLQRAAAALAEREHRAAGGGRAPGRARPRGACGPGQPVGAGQRPAQHRYVALQGAGVERGGARAEWAGGGRQRRQRRGQRLPCPRQPRPPHRGRCAAGAVGAGARGEGGGPAGGGLPAADAAAQGELPRGDGQAQGRPARRGPGQGRRDLRRGSHGIACARRGLRAPERAAERRRHPPRRRPRAGRASSRLADAPLAPRRGRGPRRRPAGRERRERHRQLRASDAARCRGRAGGAPRLPPTCLPTCPQPETPACRLSPACHHPVASLSPACRQPVASVPRALARQVFDVDGDATHRGHRLSNGGAAAALTAALAPGSVARVVFGGGGDPAGAPHDAAEAAPGSAARVAGAAGVAHDTHQGQKHPSRPQLIEAYAQHVHSGALHAYAADDEAASARVTNSETHAASADPVERRRERGRRPMPRQEGAVSQLFTASEYPEPPPQRWDDSTFERRLKGDVHRHHRQYIEAPSRSQLRQLSRAVGGGGRPAERVSGPRSPYNAARSKSRWPA
eukprot:scaffold35306_cov61-Phaeocystis_antarctica.AAC.2